MAELELLPYDEYMRRLPRKRMSAGVVIRDPAGRVLLVEPSYKTGWEIPGGVVEDDEAPWVAAVRETREEIGLVRDLGRLLVVDHVPAESVSLPERMAFLFDAGTIDPADVGRLTFGPEILSAALCEPSEVRKKVAPVLADRLAAALRAAAVGETALCVRGKRVG